MIKNPQIGDIIYTHGINQKPLIISGKITDIETDLVAIDDLYDRKFREIFATEKEAKTDLRDSLILYIKYYKSTLQEYIDKLEKLEEI